MINFKLFKKSIYDIISFGLLARILTFFKGVLLAYFIGANLRTDTYLVAFSATMLLTKIIADGLTVSLVPKLQEIDKRDGLKGRNDFTNNIVNSFILFSFVLMGIGYIAAPIIIKAMSPGFTGNELSKIIYLFRLGLPIMTFHFIRAIGGGYLQSIHRFRAGAKSGVVNPIIYILYLSIFGYRFGLEGLMIAGIIAAIGQAYVLYNACVKAGYKYKFYIFLKDRTIKRVFTFILPITIGIGINEINSVVDNAVGSILETGTIAHLTYSNDIIALIMGIFIMAIVTAIFPILSENYNKHDMDNLIKTINYSIELLTLIVIPATIIFITMSEPIVKLFYERGAFGVDNTYRTAQLLRYYSIGILGSSFLLLLVRIFYALQDTNTPLVLGTITLFTNIILDIILAKNFEAKGIALGTSLSVLITSALGIYILNKRIYFTSWKTIYNKFLRIIYSSVIMVSVIITIKINLEGLLGNTFIGNLFFLSIVSVMGIAAFALVIFAFKLQSGIFDY